MTKRFIYRVSLPGNTKQFDYLEKWDIFDSFIVCCETEDQARKTHPNGTSSSEYSNVEQCWIPTKGMKIGTDEKHSNFGWLKGKDIHHLEVELIGTALRSIEPGIILASYNAG